MFILCSNKMAYQNNFKQFLNRTPNSPNAENDTLKQKEICELEAAINNSKETAGFEEQQREIQKKFYKGTSNNNSIEESTKISKQAPKKNKSQLDLKIDQELKITFQDLPEVSGKSLDIIYHSPIFDLPIITDPQYKKCSIHQKTKKLINYYTKIDKLRAKLAKESLQRAPYPKPIMPSNKFKHSLSKNGLDEENGNYDDFFDQSAPQETYVSRSGRQVKRKNYTEDTEVDSDPDFAYFTKKNKADDSDTKITLDTPYIPEENHTEEKTKPVKPRKDTPRRPSALSLKRTGTTRSELVLEKVAEEEEKRRKQQEEMENFERTLPNTEEIDEDRDFLDTSPTKETTEDVNFIKRRVPPPIPLKKGLRGRKTNKQDLDKSAAEKKAVSPPSSPVLKRYTNLTKTTDNRTRGRAKIQKTREDSQIQASSPKVEKTSCPICNRQFLQSEIMNHASACGEEDDSFGEAVEETSNSQKIKCELCDREFTISTEYEVHVQHCIAANVSDM